MVRIKTVFRRHWVMPPLNVLVDVPCYRGPKSGEILFSLGPGNRPIRLRPSGAVFREHLAISGDAAKDLRIDLDQFLAQE
jgi:hypothetical protein